LGKDPRVMSNALKAAESVLDRGEMPRGAAIKGLDTSAADVRASLDFRALIDEMVAREGVETVRMMKSITNRKDFRDYFEGKWPQVLSEVEPAMEGVNGSDKSNV